MIELFDYRKKYGKQLILEAGNRTFEQGIYWIKGVNGSGKTTLLKSIAGIIPFEGSIKIDGLDAGKNAMSYRKLVSFSEAEPAFPSYLSSWELINYYSSIRNDNSANVKSLQDVLGVDQFLHQQCGGYSAGMLKKLSICLAFIGSPKWILLDEPFAFIDDETEKSLIELIKQYNAQGCNFILTSHHEFPFGGLNVNGPYQISNKELKG